MPSLVGECFTNVSWHLNSFETGHELTRVGFSLHMPRHELLRVGLSLTLPQAVTIVSALEMPSYGSKWNWRSRGLLPAMFQIIWLWIEARLGHRNGEWFFWVYHTIKNYKMWTRTVQWRNFVNMLVLLISQCFVTPGIILEGKKQFFYELISKNGFRQ